MTKKWFTVATEGQTTDQRNITREWLEQIAATYDRNTFGARIWIEHLRGTLPDSPFKAQGDVLAVRTQEGADGKLQLQAQLDPTASLVAMTTKDRQKIYSSIEVDPDFAGTGKAYLRGLGVTDNPASLGTDVLSFCAQHPEEKHPFANRKHRPENAFSSALPVDLDFSEPTAAPTDARLLTKIKDMFTAMTTKNQPEKLAELGEAFSAFADGYAKTTTGLMEEIAKLNTKLDSFGASHVTADEFKKLADKLEFSDAGGAHRAPATGGDGQLRTDC
ncbi:GPO family capsid scaffolding protein [Achromobacter sp. UMC71]|uniref:GPO family capsid scaffolding protein n=1 Tax=Achromobacter sp. UMC71 TaxID=1862320 RepID=UPI0016036451|nr:GPO family capsid scaffolding protein [Achromobacter sp. UMC71]MBB1625170.1 hypothetical protein [Achromobacter sp. UMC71]